MLLDQCIAVMWLIAHVNVLLIKKLSSIMCPLLNNLIFFLGDEDCFAIKTEGEWGFDSCIVVLYDCSMWKRFTIVFRSLDPGRLRQLSNMYIYICMTGYRIDIENISSRSIYILLLSRCFTCWICDIVMIYLDMYSNSFWRFVLLWL